MIILGARYTFLDSEINYLKKIYGEIYHIPLQNQSNKEIIKSINTISKNKKLNLIVINARDDLQKQIVKFLTKQELKGARIITIEYFLEKYLKKCFIDDKSTSYLENIHTYNKIQYIQKRVIDFIGVIILSIIAIPSIIISYFKIKEQSPGPLFFKQKRVGIYEKEFCCIKIRSMHTDAEENGAKFATENDPRTFPWGRYIRNTKIDELGQLWNVIKGDMHLIGPRPERRVWIKEFEKEIPYYSKRHLVKPGITGLAQIKYQYGCGKLDAYQKLMYDLYYIKEWSLKLELQITIETFLFIIYRRKQLHCNTSQEFKTLSQEALE